MSESFVDFFGLSLEIRRLRYCRNAIIMVPFLINKHLKTDVDFYSHYQSEDAKRLLNICKIIVYKFKNCADSSINILINLAKHSKTKFGPLIMIETILLTSKNSFGSNAINGILSLNPNFFQRFFINNIYSDPSSTFSLKSTEFLPFSYFHMPHLQNMKNNGSKAPSNSFLIQFLLDFSISSSFHYINECIDNETLFGAFSNFVFNCPKFFILFNKIFDSNKSENIFLRLKQIDAKKLLEAFLLTYNHVNNTISQLFIKYYTQDEILDCIDDQNVINLFNFLETNGHWNIIEIVYRKFSDPIRNILIQKFERNPSKYFERYSKLKLDFLIDVLSIHQIQPQNYKYILNHKNIVTDLMNQNPNFFLDTIINPYSSNVDESIFNDITNFFYENPGYLQRPYFQSNNIVEYIYNQRPSYYFKLFNPDLLDDALEEVISNIKNNEFEFPLIDFFDSMAQYVDIQMIFDKFFDEHGNLLYNDQWKCVWIDSKPFFSMLISQANEKMSDQSIIIIRSIITQYIQKNYEILCNDLQELSLIINFFLTNSSNPFSLLQFSKHAQLLLLECFSSCSSKLFSESIKYNIYRSDNDLDLCDISPQQIQNEKLNIFINFYKLLEKSEIFQLKSPSNEILYNNFILPLIGLNINPVLPDIFGFNLLSDFSDSLEGEVTSYSDSLTISYSTSRQLGDDMNARLAQYIENSLQSIDKHNESLLIDLGKLMIEVFSLPNSHMWHKPYLINDLSEILFKFKDKISITPCFVKTISYLLTKYKDADNILQSLNNLMKAIKENCNFTQVLEELFDVA